MSQERDKADAIAKLLGGRTLCCAESCTGGRVVQAFATVEYASKWLRGGLVAYQLEIKRRQLGVRAESMYTEQCAAEMALGAAKLFEAEVALSTTGVVGDEPEDGVAPGTIFIGTFVDGEVVTTRHHVAELGAAGQSATNCALSGLLEHLLSTKRYEVSPSGRAG